MTDALATFGPETAAWFSQSIGTPTPVQEQAWPLIAQGGSVLVSAPTGTGKTLAAFLVLIDRLKALAQQAALPDALQVIYISPLKALGNDIRENLRRPLEGIGGPDIRVGIRTGDTTASERQKQLRHPPHILITTPESLYLLLTTARGRVMLATARTVILDELHVLLSSKRGAHLMLSLSRLDRLCGRKLQRIGLSATIHPLSTAASYLAPGQDVAVVAPAMHKAAEIQVNGVLPDMRALPEGTIWPELCRAVYAYCQSARTVIAFVEGRAQAEKLAYGVNQLAGEGFARTHHGSVSKEQRLEAEAALRSGQLRLLCATSSMELGIDVGDIDLVLQVGYPLTISSTLQRLGRAGHNPGRTSVMHLFPRTAAEGVACGLTATVALEGGIEPIQPPLGCLDVLSQHLVSMAVEDRYTVEEALDVAHGAYNFHGLTQETLCGVLRMLAGDYEHEQDHPVRPRLLYDRIHGTVTGDAYSRILALSAGGTIPDKGLYPVYLKDGTRLGELEEEFVFEARVGDKFLLGAFAWRFAEILRDRVVVTPTSPEGAQPPFWKGDSQGRAYPTSLRFGALQRALFCQQQTGRLLPALQALRLDDPAARNAARYLERQIEVTGCLPDDRTILVEHFADEAGEHQIMVHSVFGRRVNYALSLLLQRAASQAAGVDVRAFEDDDGILLYAIGTHALPDGLLQCLNPEGIEGRLRAMLPATPLFFMNFRYNAARALMMGARSGKRLPLWIQRMRGAETLSAVADRWEHPLMAETLRECMEDYLDLAALREVLQGIHSGVISVRELHLDTPSPMALPLRRQVESVMIYEYTPIPTAAQQAAEQALSAQEGLPPTPGALEAQQARRRQPEDVMQLHSLLMAEGDWLSEEIDAPVEWLESLAQQGRILYIEPGLWICAEQQALYEQALEAQYPAAQLRLARRCLRYHGPQDAASLHGRYLWPLQTCAGLLETLCQDGTAVLQQELYYHAELYARAQRQTLMARRQVETLPPERYAALMARGLYQPGRPEVQLEEGLCGLLGQGFAPRLWESVLLPARVRNYRPALLDALLAQGAYTWRIQPGERPLLTFYRASEVDYEAPYILPEEPLTEDEQLILNTLAQRGASFTHALAPLLEGRPILDVLLALMMRGLVSADSLVPLRQWLALEEGRKRPPKQVARIRAAAQQAGRWERVRPLKAMDSGQCLLQDFAHVQILCRETVGGLPWPQALEILRVWEYTGRVRRGYYISGLSGAQFILKEDYERVMAALRAPGQGLQWLSAVDPLQPWGRILPHEGEHSAFLCVPGTAVCLCGGRPVAVLERQGETLRVLEETALPQALAALSESFQQRRLFPDRTRLVVRRYPPEAVEALKFAGFLQEMLDFTLWRNP